VIVPISADDPRVDDYRAIPDPELLRTRGVFVAEGRLVVGRLLRSARFRTRSLLVNHATLDSLRASFDVEGSQTPVYVADTTTLSAIGGYNFHRGCLALGERPAAPSTGAPAIDALALDRPDARLLVILEGLAQADNVGSVFRNAHAFGADAVLLDAGCCDPLYRKALRTSTGATLDVPFARIATDELHLVKALGYRLVALTARGQDHDPVPIECAELMGRVALMAGAEGPGLSDAWMALADERVCIPMAVDADSLNVATATGIALHRCFPTG
jgi:tRNA G18 (ribose-2'-O)-methylase SpoU